jgi:hypothetical protein
MVISNDYIHVNHPRMKTLSCKCVISVLRKIMSFNVVFLIFATIEAGNAD